MPENEIRALLIFAKVNAGTAAPDDDHNFITKIRARMGNAHAISTALGCICSRASTS